MHLKIKIHEYILLYISLKKKTDMLIFCARLKLAFLSYVWLGSAQSYVLPQSADEKL